MRSSRRATSALRVSASSSTAQCASVPSSSRSSLSSSGVVPRSSSCVPALLARFLASDPVGWGSCRHDSADAPLSPRTCSGSSRPSCVSGSSRGFLRPRTSLTRRSPTRPVPQRALAARQAADDRLGPADGQRRVPRVRGSFPSALSSPPPASFLQPDSSSLHPSQASPTSSSASSSAPTTRTSCGTSSSPPRRAPSPPGRSTTRESSDGCTSPSTSPPTDSTLCAFPLPLSLFPPTLSVPPFHSFGRCHLANPN